MSNPKPIEGTALHFCAAVYGNPQLGPVALHHVPDETYLPEEARLFYSALIKGGVGEARIDYPTVEPLIASDKFAKKVRETNAYLLSRSGGVSNDEFESYARRIRNWSDNIRLSAMLKESSKSIGQSEEDIGQVAAGVISQIEHIARTGAAEAESIETVALDVADMVSRWRSGEVAEYMASNIPRLDMQIGGFPVGEITVVAGPTSGGKTAFLVEAIKRFALGKTKRPGALVVFSAEMSSDKLVARLASNISGIKTRELRSGKLASDDPRWEQFVEVLISKIKDFPIVIDPTPDPTWEYMFAVLKKVQATTGLAGYAVDYLEKINQPMFGKGQGDDQLRVDMIVSRQKKLAKSLGAPGILLSQYSRKASHDRNFGKRPQNDWLRASGRVEQEANTILHVHWPKYYLDRDHLAPWPYDNDVTQEIDERSVYIVCTKNRDGETGMVRMYFDPEVGRFSDTPG